MYAAYKKLKTYCWGEADAEPDVEKNLLTSTTASYSTTPSVQHNDAEKSDALAKRQAHVQVLQTELNEQKTSYSKHVKNYLAGTYGGIMLGGLGYGLYEAIKALPLPNDIDKWKKRGEEIEHGGHCAADDYEREFSRDSSYPQYRFNQTFPEDVDSWYEHPSRPIYDTWAHALKSYNRDDQDICRLYYRVDVHNGIWAEYNRQQGQPGAPTYAEALEIDEYSTAIFRNCWESLERKWQAVLSWSIAYQDHQADKPKNDDATYHAEIAGTALGFVALLGYMACLYTSNLAKPAKEYGEHRSNIVYMPKDIARKMRGLREMVIAEMPKDDALGEELKEALLKTPKTNAEALAWLAAANTFYSENGKAVTSIGNDGFFAAPETAAQNKHAIN